MKTSPPILRIFALTLVCVLAPQLAQGSPRKSKKGKTGAAATTASAATPATGPKASAPAQKDGKTAAATKPTAGPALSEVIAKMDQVSATFKTAQADFTWDQYQKVVDEHDNQGGTIYFRRAGKETQMMSDIAQPATKQVLYSDKKVRLYEPKLDRVTVYDLSKNPAVESYLVLGFGGSGQDLKKNFDVKLAGHEAIDGVETSKLELTPKSERARATFATIILWIDNSRGISVRQQFIEPSGDYRLAKYTNIKLNEKIGEEAFKLRTTSRTSTITPQGD